GGSSGRRVGGLLVHLVADGPFGAWQTPGQSYFLYSVGEIEGSQAGREIGIRKIRDAAAASASFLEDSAGSGLRPLGPARGRGPRASRARRPLGRGRHIGIGSEAPMRVRAPYRGARTIII